MSKAEYALLQDVIMDADFPDLDLALRRGRHVDRDDAAWYSLLTDAQELLEPFYRRYGCELIHKTDGYFYLLPTGDKVSRKQLSPSDMLVGQALALLYLDPAAVERGGVVSQEDIVGQLSAVLGSDALIGLFSPGKRKKQDERIAQRNVRQRVAEAVRRLAGLGFVELSDASAVRLRAALLRFAEPVRGLSEPAEALAKLVAQGEVALTPEAGGDELEESDEERAEGEADADAEEADAGEPQVLESSHRELRPSGVAAVSGADSVGSLGDTHENAEAAVGGEGAGVVDALSSEGIEVADATHDGAGSIGATTAQNAAESGDYAGGVDGPSALGFAAVGGSDALNVMGMSAGANGDEAGGVDEPNARGLAAAGSGVVPSDVGTSAGASSDDAAGVDGPNTRGRSAAVSGDVPSGVGTSAGASSDDAAGMDGPNVHGVAAAGSGVVPRDVGTSAGVRSEDAGVVDGPTAPHVGAFADASGGDGLRAGASAAESGDDTVGAVALKAQPVSPLTAASGDRAARLDVGGDDANGVDALSASYDGALAAAASGDRAAQLDAGGDDAGGVDPLSGRRGVAGGGDAAAELDAAAEGGEAWGADELLAEGEGDPAREAWDEASGSGVVARPDATDVREDADDMEPRARGAENAPSKAATPGRQFTPPADDDLDWADILVPGVDAEDGS